MVSKIEVNEIVNQSGDNDSGIDLSTNDVVKVKTANTEQMRVHSNGYVGVGTTSPSDKLHVDGAGAFIRVNRTDGDAGITLMYNGSNSTRSNIETDTSGHLRIDTAHTNHMTLFNNGYCSIGEGASTSTNGLYVKVNKSSWGMTFHNDGDSTSREGLNIMCGTDNASGTSLVFGSYDGDGQAQGFITFSGGTVTYGAFTAHHPCILPDADNDPNSQENAYPYGTLLETTSIQYMQKNSANSERGIRYNVRKTQSANSKSILGAYGSSMNGTPQEIGDGTDNTPTVLATNEHQALILGDGHILCNNQGGNIAIGDGICSSDAEGIGMKATANPSMIIGIAQENVTFNGSETKLVPVQYGLQQFIPWS
jgi:hypothetical protein